MATIARVTANSRCWTCHGTGISTEIKLETGQRIIRLGICSCVSFKGVKAKSFAAAVAKEIKKAV